MPIGRAGRTRQANVLERYLLILMTRTLRDWIPALAGLFVALAATVPVQARDLPDFTDLVEDSSPAVVNISTESRSRPRGRGQMDDFYRWFFGPGAPDRRDAPEEREGRVRPHSLGSGFIISEDGYLLTNNHVVENADRVLVRLNDRRELEAEVIGTDPRSDLALLKVEADGLPTVKIGDSENLAVGEWVLAIGSPFGFDYSVTAGIVSAKGRTLRDENNEIYVPFIQTDVAINPGNSGGPLFNLEGEVIGINSQIYTRSGGFMGVSFAIPIDVAMEVVRQLKEAGKVTRGWLGVVIQEVSRELADGFGLDRPHGALITRVMPGSPAESGGLLDGDIILEFNGKPIDRSSDLPQLVGRSPVGEAAKLVVMRDSRRVNLAVAIGALADTQPARTFAGPAGNGDAWLGLVVEPIPDQLMESQGLDGGVRVVSATGPAAASGLRPGDVILRLNNERVTDVDAFERITEDITPGRTVPVLIARGNVRSFIPLRVPEVGE